jgi:hypothetical protein
VGPGRQRKKKGRGKRKGREGEGCGWAGLARPVLGWVGLLVGIWAPGWPRWLRLLLSPFFLFCFPFLLFSVFLISFVSFAKMLQINSNQFLKFSKNQCNDLTLQ